MDEKLSPVGHILTFMKMLMFYFLKTYNLVQDKA